MNRRMLLCAVIGFFPLIDLRATPTCVLVVQVVDEAGNPAAGAPVHVTVGKDEQNVQTNPSGAAEFTNVPCGEATVAVGTTSWDRRQGWAGTTRMLRPDVPAMARLVIVARTEVTIRLLDAKGRPVLSGVVSGVSPEGSGPVGTPDDKGIVKAWLLPGSWSFYWMGEPQGWGRSLPGRWNYEAGGHVQAEIGREPKIVDLVLDLRERLEGSVLDADGQPVAGVEVIARTPATGNFRSTARTLADGHFVLDIWELPTVVEPVAFERPLSFDPPRLTLAESPSAPVLFIGRSSSRPVLRGRVVRKDTSAAAPHAFVLVQPQCGEVAPQGVPLTDLAVSTTKTDGDGGFVARCVPECPLQVSASLEKAGGDVQLPAGACDREVLVEIEREKGWVLEGTVTDRKGVPLEGVPLALARYVEKRENADPRWVPLFYAHTGENGRFRMDCGMGGRYRMQVSRQGTPKALRDLVLVSKRSPGTRFEIQMEPEDTRSVEVRAIPGATVCARALVENQPATLSEFALYAEDEDVVVEKAQVREGGAKKDGRLCLDGIVPGRYRVRIGNPGLSMPSWYPGTEERARALPIALSSGMNDLEPVALRAASIVHLTLPGWAGADPPRIEYREPPPEGAPADAEPTPWTAALPDQVWSHEAEAVVVTLPVGIWQLRACATPRCDKEESTWRMAKPLEVPRRGPTARAVLEPPSAAGTQAADPP